MRSVIGLPGKWTFPGQFGVISLIFVNFIQWCSWWRVERLAVWNCSGDDVILSAWWIHRCHEVRILLPVLWRLTSERLVYGPLVTSMLYSGPFILLLVFWMSLSYWSCKHIRILLKLLVSQSCLCDFFFLPLCSFNQLLWFFHLLLEFVFVPWVSSLWHILVNSCSVFFASVSETGILILEILWTIFAWRCLRRSCLSRIEAWLFSVLGKLDSPFLCYATRVGFRTILQIRCPIWRAWLPFRIILAFSRTASWAFPQRQKFRVRRILEMADRWVDLLKLILQLILANWVDQWLRSLIYYIHILWPYVQILHLQRWPLSVHQLRSYFIITLQEFVQLIFELSVLVVK